MVFGLFKKKEEEKKLLEKTFPEEIPEKPLFIEEKLEMPEKEEKIKLKEELERKIPSFPEVSRPKATQSLLEDLCNRIDKESKKIKNYVKKITSKAGELTLESPEVFELIDTYVKGKKKLQEFLDEINKLDFSGLEEKEKVMVAVYKFRACKTLSEIKQQILKIEEICRKAGFMPSEVQEILQANAEELINKFIREKKK
jgi:hypothetical protein